MSWTITADLAAFETEAGPFLRERPVENSVPVTVTAALRRRGLDAYGGQPPLFGWWRPEPGAAVAAAFLRTPPHPPLLTGGPPSAAGELAEVWPGEAPGGVRGERESAEAFGAAWAARTGAEVTVERAMRLYRLGDLTPRRPAPPGRARVAGPADRELLLRWHRAFTVDIGEPPVDDERAMDDAIALGGRTVWERDGEPVAMAGRAADAADPSGTVRVVAVYTPPAHRGHGYAGGATAAVSRAALDAGARDVVLFADLANPVSNALYRHLGFRPVRDHVSLAFGDGDRDGDGDVSGGGALAGGGGVESGGALADGGSGEPGE
ncbi:GNAT family N-acetyltransferase [Streptomyces sp. NPDC003300]|uniref:GNAT family N-acetyltransferase n=1 Tax=unclassified Streptomyces TaxID=2593676 RepID=UPI0033A2484B